MTKKIHLILNMKSNKLDQIIVRDHGDPMLAWEWDIDLTHAAALAELKRLYIHHISMGNQVWVSSTNEYGRLATNILRPLDIMDDGLMALEILRR